MENVQGEHARTPPVSDDAAQPEPAEPAGRGFSFPYAVPLALYPVLAVGIAAGSGRWWGYIFIVGAATATLYFVRRGLGKKEFETVSANDPALTRLIWRINWLVVFALPGAALTLYALLKRLW